ncbi:endonuclease/exonuclease/phosphatase family protein [Streptomyces sp. SID13031]|uniref:endonuclease/exonuclease/phosphatase family protein n=1 Tax=Streptomyces sp. SID13031 TaxID=2706046 RepID=UPI0013C69BF6|nr:endonuclease/exonuclease/phosphatase family protein [Streptomyces sp. SID13031]NEA33819.1 endonuclease/exonuclease/phosphatase family protein [Streptomyces sp. SID13031]
MDTDAAWNLRRVLLSVLFLVIVALPLYPELYGLDEVTPFTQLVAFRPQFLVLVLVLGLAMLLRWNWRIAAGLVILLALTGGALLAPRNLSGPTPPPAGSRALTVMVANVLGGGADAGEVAKLINAYRPDIVSLPEARVDVRQEIEDHLNGLNYYGYTQQANAEVESATSVLVAESLGNVQFDSEKLDTGKVSSEQPGTSKPGAGEPGAQTIGPVQQTTTQFGHIIITGGNLGKLRLIAYHGYPPLPGDVTIWKQDLQVVKDWCSAGSMTVVAGDFNATTDHADFRSALGKNCKSVGPSVGEGFQGTWPANRPALFRTQIDQVVISDDIVPGKFKTYDLEGSDHRAVITTIAVPKS